MSQATPKCSTHGTKVEIGTMYRDVLTNEILVHDGESWRGIEAFKRNDIAVFEGNSYRLHEDNPTLKTAWEEYLALRLLITGE